MLLASAVLCVAVCSKEPVSPKTDTDAVRTVTIKAGTADTKVNFTDAGGTTKVTWKESGESFSAFIGSTTPADVVLFSQTGAPDASGNVAFSGDIPAGLSSDTMLYAVYPSQASLPVTPPKLQWT